MLRRYVDIFPGSLCYHQSQSSDYLVRLAILIAVLGWTVLAKRCWLHAGSHRTEACLPPTSDWLQDNVDMEGQANATGSLGGMFRGDDDET